ncbi:hypothetical protein BCR43DRAFT_521339 [Syncephalastrum racemosum]|uniref:Uncharacterized protein n=1 Tax=Syncephalastrum racemosum TaxID=13706 RepID=A0A1X2HLQ3_SYNRA|nr:hypothetical protein BCR43DRAFT_521339 [Syncephalastrum racemosum]
MGRCLTLFSCLVACILLVPALPVERRQAQAHQQVLNAPADNKSRIEAPTSPHFDVDIHRFAHLLSTHLWFDHLETTFGHLSKQISRRFHDWVRIDAQPLVVTDSHSNDDACSPVDLQILKGQIKGAVGAFIEDKLPGIWNKHARALDTASLQHYIEEATQHACSSSRSLSSTSSSGYSSSLPVTSATSASSTVSTSASVDSPSNGIISSQCLADHSQELLLALDAYVRRHLEQTIAEIVHQDMEGLLDASRERVSHVLTHFNNRHALASAGCRLELALSPTQLPWLSGEPEKVMADLLALAEHTPDDRHLDDNSVLPTSTDENYNSIHNRAPFEQSIHHYAVLARAS